MPRTYDGMRDFFENDEYENGGYTIESVYTVTLKKGGEGGGTVSASMVSGIHPGTIITLTATPNSNSKFRVWGPESGEPYFQTSYESATARFMMPARNVVIRGDFDLISGGGGGGGGGAIPTEKNVMERAIPVPSIIDHYTDAELNTDYHLKEEYAQAIDKYGNIFKIVSFSETTDTEKLKVYGREWIRRNYFDGVISFTIKALDLRMIGYNAEKLLVGDRIPVTFIDDDGAMHTKTLTCLSVKYDLLKPENTQFKIGIPGVSDNPKYRESVGLSTGTVSANTGKTEDKNQKVVGQSLVEGIRKYLGLDIDNQDKNGIVRINNT